MAGKKNERGLGAIIRKNVGRNPDGSPKLTRTWYVQLYVHGKLRSFATHTTNLKLAEQKRKELLADIQYGKAPIPRSQKITLKEVRELYVTNHEANGLRSVRRMQIAFDNLQAFFGADCLAEQINSAAVDRYIAHRRREVTPLKVAAGGGKQTDLQIKPATINVEIAALSKGLRLAKRAGRLTEVPDISRLQVDNAKKGFFEEADFRAVLAELKDRPDLQAMMIIGWYTGWRRNTEVLSLQRECIDWDHKLLTIPTSKNYERRTFPFGDFPELEQALIEQDKRAGRFAYEETLRGRATGPWLFPSHYRPGQRLKHPDPTIKAAMVRANVTGRSFHDFRRTAVRRMERAGVPRSTAMKLSGHKTEAIYRRYAIVSESDLREGTKKIAAKMKAEAGTKSQ
jgi:integrase